MTISETFYDIFTFWLFIVAVLLVLAITLIFLILPLVIALHENLWFLLIYIITLPAGILFLLSIIEMFR